MRLLIPVLVLLASCTDTTDAPDAGSSIVDVTGRLAYRQLDETSGIAQSRRDDSLLWAVNDDGAPVLYGIGHDGSRRGAVEIRRASNRDWEDLETFELDDTAYLLVADTGDNMARRRDVSLYVVQEPDPGQGNVDIAWEIEFTYPDGPRDAEAVAVAVDIDNERVLVLSKRDIPARLYAVPLRPDPDGSKTRAELLGVVDSLPQPTRREINAAPITDSWHWQPTGMAIAADKQSAMILTYGGVFYYTRSPSEEWSYALRRSPLVLPLRRLPGAESITMSRNGDAAFITTEGLQAPLLRVDLTGNRPAATSSVSIMTFNVLNLFDTVDDPAKNDETFLPLAAKSSAAHIESCNRITVRSWRDECLLLDWNDDVLDHKLRLIAETIKQVDEGRGPDVIAFQEVENAAILDRLSREYLPESDYGPAILIEGQDVRGIDVAFLSRLPLVGEPVLHSLQTDYADRQGDTRGVLQATFRLPDGQLLTGFAVHFPAPYQPVEMREVAYEHLNALRAKLPADHIVFAAGDFNTPSIEDRDTRILERLVRPTWTVAHDHCNGCPGTYYYRPDDSWSFLDSILVAPLGGRKTTWRLREDSVRLVNDYPEQVSASGTPRGFDAENLAGVSDHWPLLVRLELATEQ